MYLKSIGKVLVRDLRAVSREVESYPDDESLWKVVPGIGNSGGNLALHVAGNLQHFVGAQLGESGYVRDREAEFSPEPRPRAFVLAELENAERSVADTLSSMPDSKGAEQYPAVFAEYHLSIAQFMVHLATHLAFHLGQIDYHRRILTAEKGRVSPVSIALIDNE